MREPPADTGTVQKKTNTRRNGVGQKDRELWEALRECRKQLAADFNIPGYMIFHDATLMEMMESKPQTESEMLSINGVGEAKLQKFGPAFLETIKQHS